MAFAGRAGRGFEPPRRRDAKNSKIIFSGLSRRVQLSIYLHDQGKFSTTKTERIGTTDERRLTQVNYIIIFSYPRSSVVNMYLFSAASASHIWHLLTTNNWQLATFSHFKNYSAF